MECLKIMEKLTTLTTRCVPVNQNNIDTDQIIPARFLKITTKTGLGKNLFYDWRYNEDGSPKSDFTLNQPQYQGAKILLAPHNFGCGSSREHAPWAIADFGVRVIIAISFADIFQNNSMKNGLLPISLPEAVVLKLLEDVAKNPALEVSVDLPKQTVKIPGQPDQTFEINAFRKTCLMEGLDDIGYTLKHEADIARYEAATI